MKHLQTTNYDLGENDYFDLNFIGYTGNNESTYSHNSMIVYIVILCRSINQILIVIFILKFKFVFSYRIISYDVWLNSFIFRLKVMK